MEKMFKLSRQERNNLLKCFKNLLGFGKEYKYENYSIIKINRIMDIMNFRDYIYKNAVTLLDRKLTKFKEIK